MRPSRITLARVIAALVAAEPVSLASQAARGMPSLQVGARYDAGAAVAVPFAVAAERLPPALRDDAARPSRRAPFWAPIASLVAPGSGQIAMRQARGVGFAAAEVYAWIQFVEARRDSRARRNEYRRTAREVARRNFGGGPDGPWSYYEALFDKPASGAYNQTPGSVLTPETDTSTFNGTQWLKARQLFWDDPEVPPPASDARYQRAIGFYQSNAWPEGYLWSWRDQQLQWDLYKSTIARENRSTRDMTTTLGIIIANHLLSGVDALASVRLRRVTGTAGERRIEASVPWPARNRRPR